MTRSARTIALAGASAVALALVTPGLAQADDAAPAFSRGGTATMDPNPLYAGYTSELGAKKTVTGIVTLPTLGDCSTDGGILVAIEMSDLSGGDYVDGGSYSSCVGGVKSHSVIIESAVEGQVLLGEGEDGDKLKVTQKVNASGDVEVTVENVTQGWEPMTEVVSGANIQVATGLHWGQIFVGGAPVPTLDYDKLPITKMVVGGKPLKKTNPTKYDYVPSGDVVLKTSKIKKKKNYTTSNVA